LGITVETPVVFDEAKNGALVGERAINEVDLGSGRDDKQRQARAIDSRNAPESCCPWRPLRGAIAALADSLKLSPFWD